MKIRHVIYLDKLHYYCQNKFGFRTGRSLENALSGVTERIHGGFNAK